MARSLNNATLIGNITRDPEMRYTPSGSAVTNFSIATNRQWKDSQGQDKDEVTFHRVVAWGKLAEICSQYLKKGSKVYVAGRIANRKWTDKQNVEHTTTEIVLNEMLMLDNKGGQDIPVQDYPNEPPEPES
jgi:single-strand DNA-binding protein